MKLSIITINYNNLEGLKKTAESVMSQTWRDYEWILIDGGSTDGSKEYIDTLANNPGANVSYWCSEKDSGVYNAMNKGLAKANGEYLNFMNSGDCFCNEHVLANVFKNNHTADIVYGDWFWVDGVKRRKEVLPYPYTVLELYNKYNICHQAMFILRETHLRFPYDESYKIYADMKNWILMALNQALFEYIPIAICDFEMGGICCRDVAANNAEYDRIWKEVWTPMLSQALDELIEYKKIGIDVKELQGFQRHKNTLSKLLSILNKGGLKMYFVRRIIKILC